MEARERTLNGTFKKNASRAQALMAGLKHYTGKDCPKKHGGFRFISNSGCVECLKDDCKKYYYKNIDAQKKRNRDYVKNDPEGNRRRSADWAKDNTGKIAVYGAAWKKQNPGKVAEHVMNRRAIKKGNGGKMSTEEWSQVKAKFGNKCLCCGKSGKDAKVTLDHVIPLSKGGAHSPENAQPLCQRCNSKKGTKSTDYRGTHV